MLLKIRGTTFFHHGDMNEVYLATREYFVNTQQICFITRMDQSFENDFLQHGVNLGSENWIYISHEQFKFLKKEMK